MSKWLSVELSLLLLVSLFAFAGFVSLQSSGDNFVTGDLPFGRPSPRPTWNPLPTPVPTVVTERVICDFVGSSVVQKCYSDDGKFECSGTRQCTVKVSGEKGKPQTWKSSCGGYGYNTFDGNDNSVEFECDVKKPELIPVPTKTPVPAPTKTPTITTVDATKLNIKSIQPTIVMDAGGASRYQIWVGNGDFNIWNSAEGKGKFTLGPKGDITSSYLSGKGNAYVCVNEAGFMFRSSKACV